MKKLHIYFSVRGFSTQAYSPLKEALLNGPPQKAFRVITFGDGSHGALGHNQGHLSDAYEPVEVEGLPKDVVRVAAGHYHSLAVTGAGELWAWGRNVENQLGRGINQPREQWSHPQKVQGLEGVKVREAAASGVISMAIDVCGSLWAWGKSKRGQLGLGEQVIEASCPQRIQALAGQNVLQVSLGWGHALACTVDGKLYSWGYSADGRLGFYPKSTCSLEESDASPTHETLDKAELLELVEIQVQEDIKRELAPVIQCEPHLVDLGGHRAVEVACGFDHSIVLCENGQLLSFGDDTYGQLGRIAERDSAQLWNVSLNTQVASIGAGLGHSLAVALSSMTSTSQQLESRSAGTAYSWGWNSAFQLGRITGIKPMKVLGLAENQVLRLDGGRVHSIAVASQGQLWTWGSGKNGRLGLGSFSDAHQPCLVESLQDYEVQQAACGMDHTLVLVSDRSWNAVDPVAA